jgi:hypothetical protein
MSGFTKLVPEIIQSSIWNESSDVRVVWITLLAAKDETGYVRGDAKTIARMANVPLEAAVEALRKFQEPDESSHTPDNEGRRIGAAPGGWVILNHELYRLRDHRVEHAEYVRAWRIARKSGNVKKCESQVTHPSASASASSSASEEKGVKGEGKPSKPPRPRNLVLDALAECDGPVAEIGKAGWKRAAMALAEIREVSPDVTPEEINRRAQNYRGHLGGAMLT